MVFMAAMLVAMSVLTPRALEFAEKICVDTVSIAPASQRMGKFGLLIESRDVIGCFTQKAVEKVTVVVVHSLL